MTFTTDPTKTFHLLNIGFARQCAEPLQENEEYNVTTRFIHCNNSSPRYNIDEVRSGHDTYGLFKHELFNRCVTLLGSCLVSISRVRDITSRCDAGTKSLKIYSWPRNMLPWIQNITNVPLMHNTLLCVKTAHGLISFIVFRLGRHSKCRQLVWDGYDPCWHLLRTRVYKVRSPTFRFERIYFMPPSPSSFGFIRRARGWC